MTDLLLAATALDVTPPPGHRLDGYAARAGLSTGTADPLNATLIWLSTADDPGVLWLTLDAIAAGHQLCAELAEAAGAAAGIPPSHVVVSASHTHSGPSGWTGEIHPVIPAERERDLIDSLVGAVRAVRLERQPVSASWRSIEVIGVGTNRHRKNGPHDNTAGILALHSRSGSLEAVLLDFACHPTTYGPENMQYSADWPGAARAALAPAVVGFLQGAAGDVSPRFTRQGRGAAEVTRLGSLLAGRVREALTQPGLELPQSAPAIRRTTLTLPVRSIPPADESEKLVTAAEQAVLSTTEQANLPATAAETRVTATETRAPAAETRAAAADDPSGRITQTRLDGARGQALMAAANLPPALDLSVSTVTFGDVCWINLPVELFAVHGACLQSDSTHPITRVIGYTDGYYGYVVDPSAAEAGTYEALITFFDQPTTNHLIKQAADFMNT
ncbi:hypothetical protein [Kribbella solani]|uniref:Neutral/alkaline non-lysosomal ceramidase N-terminal domain-containing protein n=1 Tax=Kribbella solani TaxID=236067 RepID=A0A841DTB4_9ACTN|nr:hypothetical protein [Kribbella solani]MBB5981822.1 hypothetical protein [Kribbella solani]